MFKVGDTVVCIDDSRSTYLLAVGTEYTITGFGPGVLVMLDGSSKLWQPGRFELVKEPFDVLKALREGKKVRRKSWLKNKFKATKSLYLKGDDVLDDHGHLAYAGDFVLKDDWEEYVETLEDGFYWITNCHGNSVVKRYTDGKWWQTTTNLHCHPPVKILNKVEGPIE